MSREPRYVIELLGQPGSGKSTLVRAVNEDVLPPRSSLSDRWHRQSRAKIALNLAKTAIDGPCLVAAVQLMRRARLYNGDSVARLLRLLVKSHWLRSQHGTFLLQEGHLQDLWSILYSSGRTEPHPRLVAPLIRCLYRGTDVKIILLDLSPEAIFVRIRTRTQGKSRLDRLSDEQLTSELLATARLPRILAAAAQMAGLTVEHLDASLPIETMAEQLRSIMQNSNAHPPSSG